MNSPNPVTLAVGGAVIAFGLAAAVALAPEATPRLLASPAEYHDHHTYYVPINTPYTTYVDVCVDRPATVRITGAEVDGGAPALQQFGAGSGPVVVSTPCPATGDDHAEAGQSIPVTLAGQSPAGVRRTVIHLTYTIDGHDGTQQTDAVLPGLHQRPT